METVHILQDWIQGTFPEQNLEGVESLFDGYLDLAGQPVDKGRYRYDSSRIYPDGIAIYFDRRDSIEKHKGRAMVAIPGRALSAMTDEQKVVVIRHLNQHGFKPTRLDIAVDDYSMKVKPESLARALHDGKAEPLSFRKFGVVQETKVNGEVIGDTLYLGTRGDSGSGCFIRYYRKDLESGGDRKCFRWEAEFTGKKAVHVWSAIVDATKERNYSDVCKVLGQYVGGYIEFTSAPPRIKSHLQKLIASLGQARAPDPRVPKTVERTMDWVSRCVVPALHFIDRATLGNAIQFAKTEMQDNPARLSHEKVLAVKEYRAVLSGKALRSPGPAGRSWEDDSRAALERAVDKLGA